MKKTTASFLFIITPLLVYASENKELFLQLGKVDSTMLHLEPHVCNLHAFIESNVNDANELFYKVAFLKKYQKEFVDRHTKLIEQLGGFSDTAYRCTDGASPNTAITFDLAQAKYSYFKDASFHDIVTSFYILCDYKVMSNHTNWLSFQRIYINKKPLNDAAENILMYLYGYCANQIRNSMLVNRHYHDEFRHDNGKITDATSYRQWVDRGVQYPPLPYQSLNAFRQQQNNQNNNNNNNNQ